MHSLRQHLRHYAGHSTELDRTAGLIDPSSLNPLVPGSSQSTKDTTLSRTSPYDGIARTLIRPVFKKACALRFMRPTVQDLIHQSRTQLDIEIVNAILEGALRLVPADPSLQGTIIRKQAEAAKAAQAAKAESAFVRKVRSYQSRLMDEDEQRRAIRAAIDAGEGRIVRATPDILFLEPTMICGTRCKWIEYKNTLGFKDNPFVHKKHKQQLRRYVDNFGNGMVVYKLGFECNLMQVEGLAIQREAVVVGWLQSQSPL